MAESFRNFLIEVWTSLAIDIVLVVARVFLRRKSSPGLAPDDFLMVVAIFTYTSVTVMAHLGGQILFWSGKQRVRLPSIVTISAWRLTLRSMTMAHRKGLDPSSHDYHVRQRGSQVQLIAYCTYTCTLWALKVYWLFFYQRLGEGVDHMRFKIKLGFVFVGATFIANIAAIFMSCMPVHKYWQIYPNPGISCQIALSKVQSYVSLFTNQLTDFYIMSIPLPMVWSARIPLARKFLLMSMFCGGLINAVVGIIRVAFCLLGRTDSGGWSCRELFIATFITNIPVMYAPLYKLLRRLMENSPLQWRKLSPRDGDDKDQGGHRMSAVGKLGRKETKHKRLSNVLAESFHERFGSEENIVVVNGQALRGVESPEIKNGAVFIGHITNKTAAED